MSNNFHLANRQALLEKARFNTCLTKRFMGIRDVLGVLKKCTQIDIIKIKIKKSEDTLREVFVDQLTEDIDQQLNVRAGCHNQKVQRATIRSHVKNDLPIQYSWTCNVNSVHPYLQDIFFVRQNLCQI